MNTALLLAGLLQPAAAVTAAPPPATALEAVQVRALGLPGRDAFDLPASTSVVEVGQQASAASVDLAGAFSGVAGVLARDRHNRAQDLQLSIRGYGARSTFGVRGIRVLADGLPAGAPDGQAQLTQFNLLGVERIEVVRGPFAALHGNASGGVVQLLSDRPAADDPWWLQVQAGSDGEAMLGARLQGELGGVGYRIVPMHWRSDGAREHSRAQRSSLATRLDWDLPGQGTLSVSAQYFDAPDAQDPRALTDQEWRRDPRLAVPVATSFNTRKSVRQDQLGAVWEQPLGSSALRLAAHAGQREVLQFLSIPAAAQANPLHGGGVVEAAGEVADDPLGTALGDGGSLVVGERVQLRDETVLFQRGGDAVDDPQAHLLHCLGGGLELLGCRVGGGLVAVAGVGGLLSVGVLLGFLRGVGVCLLGGQVGVP